MTAYLTHELHHDPGPGDVGDHGMKIRWLLETPYGLMMFDFRHQVDTYCAKQGWGIVGK